MLGDSCAARQCQKPSPVNVLMPKWMNIPYLALHSASQAVRSVAGNGPSLAACLPVSSLAPSVASSASHRIAVYSEDPVSTREPLGLNATEDTQPFVPVNTRICSPLSAFQRIAVLWLSRQAPACVPAERDRGY